MLTYPLIKSVHHLAIGLSLTLFVLRWVGVLWGQRWPMNRAARQVSVAIDVVLLAAGVSLWVWGGWHPWHNPWLGGKLVLLVAYVLAGSWALKRARTQRGHVLAGVLALAIAGQMVGMALRHHPAGWLLPWAQTVPADVT